VDNRAFHRPNRDYRYVPYKAAVSLGNLYPFYVYISSVFSFSRIHAALLEKIEKYPINRLTPRFHNSADFLLRQNQNPPAGGF
jgi:hypothetical protein